MTAVIGRRLLIAVPILIVVLFIASLLVNLSPGDPAALLAGDNATPQRIAEIHQQLGLDRPILTRFFEYLGGVFHGDLGVSMFSGQTVVSAIGDALPVTLSIALVAFTFSLLIAIPAGIAAATNRNGWADRIVSALGSFFIGVPPFVAGLVLVIVLALSLRMFPATGYVPIATGGVNVWLTHLILPGLALALPSAAEVARQLRGALVDVMEQDFIRTQRAKGMAPVLVLSKHGLKNAAPPVLTGTEPAGGPDARRHRDRRAGVRHARVRVAGLQRRGPARLPLLVHTDMSRDERRERVIDLLRRVGMDTHHLDRYPYEFSGGQLQRIAIARAISTQPDLIVCDEPVAALDMSIRAQVVNLLRDLQEERGIAYLFITHDLSLVRLIADRVVVMYRGVVVESAPVHELFAAPRHPYTRVLLDAVPVPDTRRRNLTRSRALALSNPAVAGGCPFGPRCPHAHEACTAAAPPLISHDGHEVACLLNDGAGSDEPMPADALAMTGRKQDAV